MTEPQIPDDLKALYDAALARRDMPLSGASPEEFELRVHARAQCSLIERIAKVEAGRDALKARNEEIMKAALETSAAKGERIRELEAQVARLTEPVSDEEWAEFQQISRSEGGVMQRFRINDLLAARKETP